MGATQCSTRVDGSCLGGKLRGNLLEFFSPGQKMSQLLENGSES